MSLHLTEDYNAKSIACKWTAIFFAIGFLLLSLSYLLPNRYLNLYGSSITLGSLFFLGILSVAVYFIICHLLKKLIKKLSREEKFIETAINSVPGIFFVVDKNGSLIRWNENIENISGLDEKELQHINVLDRVEPHDYTKAEHTLEKVWQDHSVQTTLDLVTRYDEATTYEITVKKFESNDKTFAVGTGLDMSESISIREHLKRQNYRLRAASEIAQIGYWENDLDNNELIWSDYVYELFGVEKESFQPSFHKFLQLIHPDDRHKHLLGNTRFRQEGYLETEYRIIRPDGEIRWMQEIGEVFKRDNSHPLILHGIVMDITARKNRESEIRNAYIEGENKERKRIANELHDGVAQYLSSALLNFDAAESSVETIEPPHRDQLLTSRKLIKEASTETRMIARNLMPRAVGETGIEESIHSLIEQYRLSTNIQFSFNSTIDDAENILSDKIATNVYRIIQELLSNAVRHAHCKNIQLKLKSSSGKLRCTVIDDGIGTEIPDVEQTSGLGLRSVHDRIDMLEGSIQFSSTAGEGMTTKISIPLH